MSEFQGFQLHLTAKLPLYSLAIWMAGGTLLQVPYCTYTSQPFSCTRCTLSKLLLSAIDNVQEDSFVYIFHAFCSCVFYPNANYAWANHSWDSVHFSFTISLIWTLANFYHGCCLHMRPKRACFDVFFKVRLKQWPKLYLLLIYAILCSEWN